jgi:hypothetical protein
MAAIESVAVSQLFDHRKHLRCCHLHHIRLARNLIHLRVCRLSDYLPLFAQDRLCNVRFDRWIVVTKQHIYDLQER